MERSLFLVILKGGDACDSEPVVATEDPEIIALLGREIARRLGACPGVDALRCSTCRCLRSES